jgi:ElaB/YqjD/DUF883 family membrane-anchored ribosome-binding protein
MMETTMSTNVETGAADITSDLSALRRDVASLADTMGKLMRHQAQAAGERAFEAVGNAKNRLASTAAGAQNRVCAAGTAFEAGVARHPLTSTLIALGIGMSLGLVSRWRI